MHYLSVSNGFGRHNQDNMYRWETAGYLNWANAVAGDILASPEGAASLPAVHPADRQARMAKAAFDVGVPRGRAQRARGLRPGRAEPRPGDDDRRNSDRLDLLAGHARPLRG